MEVRPELGTQPNLLALSLDGVGKGAGNALKLASAFEDVQEMLDGRSLRQNYEAAIVDVTQNVSTQEGITEGIRNYYQTLEAQHLGTSGVSLDEEAVKMLQYQRAFQATSKLIATANDMLETLVTML
ncbi:MAG: flagellar basal body rod C-terminal domain-containing protein [Pirellulales bacterium]